MDGWMDRQIDREADRQTDRQIDRLMMTDRYVGTQVSSNIRSQLTNFETETCKQRQLLNGEGIVGIWLCTLLQYFTCVATSQAFCAIDFFLKDSQGPSHQHI